MGADPPSSSTVWQNGTGDPAPVEGETWQQWDEMENGNWWSSRTSGGLEAGQGGRPFYTLGEVLDLTTDAKVEFIQLGIGSFNPDWDVVADGMTFAGTTSDFEPAPVAGPDKAACKDGGWTDADLHEEEFRNQGDCVSFSASDGTSRGPQR